MNEKECLLKIIANSQEMLLFDVYRDVHKHDEHVELLYQIRDAVAELKLIEEKREHEIIKVTNRKRKKDSSRGL